MSDDVRALIRALQHAMNETLDALAGLTDEQLAASCAHPCAHGPGEHDSVWHLLANDIDHEKMHAGQILGIRHDIRAMQTQPARLLAEWLKERAALVGTLVGLPPDALDRRLKPDEWTIREICEHTIFWERDSLGAALRELAGGEPWRADPNLDFGGPVPRPKAVD